MKTTIPLILLLLAGCASQKRLNRKLIQAVDAGNPKKAGTLLSKGADVDSKDGLGTALAHAVWRANAEMVKMLLERGADVNAANSAGDTPLIKAAQEGQSEIAKILLEKGADVHAKKQAAGGVFTALNQAALNGHSEIVGMLLEKGADPNGKDLTGDPLLVRMAELEKADIARMLLEKGADADAKNARGLTALLAAASLGNAEIVKMLLENGANVHSRGKDGASAADLAAAGGHVETAKMLLEKGAVLKSFKNLEPEAAQALQAYIQAKAQESKDVESEADKTTRTGDIGKALALYVKAAQKAPAGTEESRRLREKIVYYALSLDPPPQIPERAEKNMSRAEAYLSREDYFSAIEELVQASARAPWWDKAYYQLAVAQEKTQDYAGALENYKLYLKAAPLAPDAPAVLKKLDELEVLKEKVQKNGAP